MTFLILIISISVAGILALICDANAFLLSTNTNINYPARRIIPRTTVRVFGLQQQRHHVHVHHVHDKDKDEITTITDTNEGSSAIISRRMLFGLTTTMATSVLMPVSAANADPSLVSSVQSPLQDLISPGHWIGQFIGINSKTERWNFPSGTTPSQVSAALVDTLNELTPDRRAKLLIPNFRIVRADSSGVHVLTWTKSEWLDSFDVSYGKGGDGCVATVSFYATGFLPTSIPLAPVVNLGLAFIPFASPGPRGEMLQTFRLRAIKGLLDKKLLAVEGSTSIL